MIGHKAARIVYPPKPVLMVRVQPPPALGEALPIQRHIRPRERKPDLVDQRFDHEQMLHARPCRNSRKATLWRCCRCGSAARPPSNLRLSWAPAFVFVSTRVATQPTWLRSLAGCDNRADTSAECSDLFRG